MTTPADPDAEAATPLPAATSRYPRNGLVRLLRNLLLWTGLLVVILVVMTITDPHPNNFGTALGKVFFPFGQPGEGIILALLVLGAAWAVYDELQEVRLTPRVPWSKQRLQRAREEEPRARKDYERAHRRGKPRQVMDALSRLGSSLFNQERYEEAMQVYQEWLELGETLRDPKAQFSSLRVIAMISERQGDLERARRLYERRVMVARDIKERNWLFEALEEFAAFAQEHSDLPLAESLFRENLAMTHTEGLPAYTPYALAQLGGFLVSGRGQREQGCAMMHEAAELCHASGDDAEEDLRERMRELGCE
ncbi:MAG TPA: tetratricopeptide repeat protein [Ktedonobacterales bacterium]